MSYMYRELLERPVRDRVGAPESAAAGALALSAGSTVERRTAGPPPAGRNRSARGDHVLREEVERLLDQGHRLLVRHSVGALRIALGAVFLAFGVLKFFPGVSPAENLASTATGILTLHLIPSGVSIVLVAALECFIGLALIVNRAMPLTLGLLSAELVGILSPVVLLTGRLFSGPHGAPSLEGQYVIKDVILVAAAMVIAAVSFKGGRLVRDEPEPTSTCAPATGQESDAGRKLESALTAIAASKSVDAFCEDHGISPPEYYEWRNAVLREASRALEETGTGSGRALR